MKLRIGRRSLTLSLVTTVAPELTPLPDADDRDFEQYSRFHGLDSETIRWQGLAYLYGASHPMTGRQTTC